MSDQLQDAGVMTALLERLRSQRLPQALALKDKVDRGETLEQRDIDFLEQAFADALRVEPLVTRNPEYHDIAGRVVGLYKEITEKALQNEQAKGRS